MDQNDTCAHCDEHLTEPYIECCQCESINLCTSCFASGQEVGLHKNNHMYAVRKSNFPLFESCNWSAKEEEKLLTALSLYGYGNWEEIAKVLQTRTKLECQEHYKKYYIDNVQFSELNLIPHTDQSLVPREVIPYLYTTKGCDDPPRTLGNQQLAGYNAFRSDFELSFDSTAELIFNTDTNIEDDDELIQSLKISLLNALNTRLKERQRRYSLIQRHGLILMRKFTSLWRKFDSTIGRNKLEKLARFLQLSEPMEFDKFIEMINLEREKTQKLTRLCEYRRCGIQSLHGAKVYEEMRLRKDNILKEQRFFTQAIEVKFTSKYNRKNSLKSINKMGKTMKKAVPLLIVDMPEYNLLSDSEKDLCSNLRMVPKTYLDLKGQLISENNKMGNLKLLDARRIAKIDVNKTRKIYDFLASEGFITVTKW